MSNIIDDIRAEADQDVISVFSLACFDQNHIHDVHQVHKKEIDQEMLHQNISIVDSVILQGKDNPGLYAGSELIAALKFIREHSDEDWVRLRVRIKREKPSGVRLDKIDDGSRPENEVSGEGSVAAALVTLVKSRCELFYDETTRGAFVTISTEGVDKTMNIRSVAFTDWLSYAYYKESGGLSASESAVKQAVSAISGLCKYEGKEARVFLRIGKREDAGAYYLFMADEKSRAIEITSAGWKLLEQYPVKFWEPESSRPLPAPSPGGSIERLWEFANIPKEDRPLILAWILDAYRIDTPFPVLELNGMQGSAKSSTQKRLRRLIDPCGVDLRSAPKNIEDVFVSAGNNWLVSYENLSHLTPQMQDAFCTMATGGGYASRTLFTNGDETIIEIKRPVVINSIPSVITAQDLTDRAVHVELPELATYREEAEIERDFEEALPRIFGGLLDLFVQTLAYLPKVALNNPPRMVDFTKLGEAMMQSDGAAAGSFTDLYRNNRKESVLRSIESSPVASAVVDMAEGVDVDTVFHGTYKELLDRLLTYKGDNEGWPKSAKGLANSLKRQSPALKEAGVIIVPEIGRQQNNRGRFVTIRKSVHSVHDVHSFDRNGSEEKKTAVLSDFISRDAEPF